MRFFLTAVLLACMFASLSYAVDSAVEIEKLKEQFEELFSQGKYDEAEAAGKRMLEMAENAFGPNHPETIQSSEDLAVLYYEMMRYAMAESLFRRVLSTKEKALGPDHWDTAESMKDLASVYREQGDYARAEPLFKHALKITENAFGPENYKTADCIIGLAIMYYYTGDYVRARGLYQRALRIKEKVFGAEDTLVAICLNNLAILYLETGNYAKAEPLLKRAIKIYEKEYGPDHFEAANTINSLGRLFHAMGDHAKAELFLKRTLKINEKVFGPDHPDTAMSLNNLALLYEDMGNYDKVESLQERALKINEKTLGADHPRTATSISNLACTYTYMGDLAKAEPLHKRALEIRERILGPENYGTASSLNNLAGLYYKMDKVDMAEPLYRRANKIVEKSLGPDHPVVSVSLLNLAHIYFSQNKFKESLALLRRSLAIDDRLIQNIFSIASEKQKLLFIQKSSLTYMYALSLIHQKFAKDQDALRIGLDLVLSRKGVVFDAQARQHEAIARAIDPEAKRLWDKLTEYRAALAKLLQSKPEELSVETYRVKIDFLQKEIEELESELSSMSALVREEVKQRKVTAKNVAKRLPKGSVLAEFVKIDDYDWKDSAKPPISRYLVFILHKDNRIELVDLGEADKLEKDLQAILRRFKRASFHKKIIMRQIEASEKMYALLWKPLIDVVGDVDYLIIGPDGILNLVPFGATRDRDGKFLTEHLTITYVTSGKDLLRGGTGLASDSDLFLVANPKFDLLAKKELHVEEDLPEEKFRSAGFSMQFAPLPATALEAETIPGLIPGKTKKVITGVDATESAVLSIRRPRVLHLATHGFFLKDQPLGGRVLSDTSQTLPSGYENPLVRSGMALAGANNAAQSPTSIDGLLTALEVSGMDLHGTDLVTLSACETGLGDVKAGEGVFGLRRAFALAGAKNLLMSLWPVSDQITAYQMNTFYRLYGEGQPPSKALQIAQIELIHNLREEYGSAPPSFWAAFIMQGPPDNR
ncbi:tetratricopeptide repeat protein [Candidatus Omnitrophota bacterium]